MEPDETHPLDESLGDLHEVSLWLAYNGLHDLAVKLASAHEQIQNYLVNL